MTPARALYLAREALRHQIKDYAFDANLFDRGIANGPMAHNASIKRQQLTEAIEVLEQITPCQTNQPEPNPQQPSLPNI